MWMCLVLFTVSTVSGHSMSRLTKPCYAKRINPVQDTSKIGETLLIDCIVNGCSVPAIVDTGAQISIMSETCLKKCHLHNDIDRRYTGKAIGVGESKIIGKVLNLPMQIGPISFLSGVSVLKDSRVDLIIGMDLLSKFESEINVKERWVKMRAEKKEYKIQFTRTPLSDSVRKEKRIDEPNMFDSPTRWRGSVSTTYIRGGAHGTSTRSASALSNSIESEIYEDEEAVSLEGV